VTPAPCERPPASWAKLAANRRNAAKSTGPRSPAGKQASCRNALKHGLAAPVRADPGLVARVDALSRLLAGEGAEASRLAPLARRVAEAQVGLERVRAARFALLALVGGGGGQHEPPMTEQRPFCPAASDQAMLSSESIRCSNAAPDLRAELRSRGGPEPKTAAVGDVARQLACLDRYEARALSRRKSAVRGLEAALLKSERD
jgi:hypothetical protein